MASVRHGGITSSGHNVSGRNKSPFFLLKERAGYRDHIFVNDLPGMKERR